MTTINDAELCKLLLTVHQQDRVVEALERNGKELALYHALDLIEDAARKAKWRLNDLRFDK